MKLTLWDTPFQDLLIEQFLIKDQPNSLFWGELPGLWAIPMADGPGTSDGPDGPDGPLYGPGTSVFVPDHPTLSHSVWGLENYSRPKNCQKLAAVSYISTNVLF